MSLIGELKRRSVFKVGAAYLVVGWLVIQAASIMFPLFEAPPWALRVFVLCVFLGFPVALVLAWVFDVTPDGIIKTDGARAGSWTFYSIAAAVMALSLAWYYFGQPAVRGDDTDARSIAVLPFVNMSGDAENEYFSDGISEEILNVLAKTPELRVAARTSSFSFKGQKLEVPEIARQLKVRMVLEGSVRKQGDRVRITAQLIDAKEGFHLWSETYDRDLKDIFAIQDEIARAIAQALKVQLGGPQAVDGAGGSGTKNLAAYDLYLKGLALWQLRREADLREAEHLFEQAVALDPGYARAWAGIAMVNTVLPYYASVDIVEVERKGRAAASRAFMLDPTLAEAVAALGNLDRLHADRMVGAMVHLRYAVTLNPSFATGHQWLGLQMLWLGDVAGAERELRIAFELDPRSPAIVGNLMLVQLHLGANDEARKLCEDVIATGVVAATCRHQLLLEALIRDDLAAATTALEFLAAARKLPTAEALARDTIAVLAGKGDKRAIAKRFAAFPLNSLFDPASPNMLNELSLPYLLLKLGEPELTLDRLTVLARDRPDYVALQVWGQFYDPIRCTPRFKAIVTNLGVVDPRAAQVCGNRT